MIFATGEGLSLGCEDGRIVETTNLPTPVAEVSVSIGGLPARLHYAGGAPGLPCGVLQVNAYVPDGLPPGNVPLLLRVGQAFSQPGVTIAIQ
jgi:uncharacterized protein (TIGR03437 family)